IGVVVSMAQLRLYRWGELLAAPRPANDGALTQAMWRYGRALSFAARGQPLEARQEQDEFESLRKKLNPKMPWGTNKLGDGMDLAAGVRQAKIAAPIAAPMAAPVAAPVAAPTGAGTAGWRAE